MVAADGSELARGAPRARGDDPVVHAEEAALAKGDPADRRLATATVYSSLEPCARRASRPAPCARLILDAGVRRVGSRPGGSRTPSCRGRTAAEARRRGAPPSSTAGVRAAGEGAEPPTSEG
ncbi:hypothetical protein LV779_38875 [Streptomyces thinghirensis]|nr:hypothetical protein [Streptomyces thinghirensis]